MAVLDVRRGVTIGGGSNYPQLYRYPLEVADQDSPHSVVFFFNRRVEGQVTRSPQNGNPDYTRAVAASQTDLEDQYAQEARLFTDNSSAVLGAAGAIGGGALGNYAAGQFGGSFVGKVVGTAVGAAAGYAAGDLVSDAYSTERLGAVVQLHIPQPIVTQYVANYNEEDIGTIAGKIAETGLNADSLLETAGNAGSFVARSAIIAAASVPKALGVDVNVSGAAAATSKKVANPYKEQLFTSMAFRKFGFNFDFVPRSQAEYNQVRAIIDLFKTNMHPTRVESGFFLAFPGEFNIEYRYKDRVNEHVNRISSCVLTDMKITYGGSESFNSIKGTLGIPSEITINLSFTELETLTSNRVALDGTREDSNGNTLVVGGL